MASKREAFVLLAKASDILREFGSELIRVALWNVLAEVLISSPMHHLFMSYEKKNIFDKLLSGKYLILFQSFAVSVIFVWRSTILYLPDREQNFLFFLCRISEKFNLVFIFQIRFG